MKRTLWTVAVLALPLLGGTALAQTLSPRQVEEMSRSSRWSGGRPAHGSPVFPSIAEPTAKSASSKSESAASDSGSKDDGDSKDDKDSKAKKSEPKHIRDNAFYVEEAFNQEPGEVQHIFNWINQWSHDSDGRTRQFLMTYTMELPLGSQKHQFSFTTQFPTSFSRPHDDSSSQFGGVGDTFLNYRYQLLGKEEDKLWCAPRISVIVPTGDKRFGTGTGETGYQVNLPISWYGEVFDFHFNGGMTYTPHVSLPVNVPVDPALGLPNPFLTADSARFDLRSYNLGASVFWKPKVNLHFFIEAIAFWNESIIDPGERASATQVLLNPGVRYAVIQDPVEWVIGVAAPIGLTRESPAIGLFAYMSVEHGFKKKDSAD